MATLTRLREVRESKFLSQADVARLAGMSRTTVVHAEQGQDTQPSTVRRLAAALKVKPQELVRTRDNGN